MIRNNVNFYRNNLFQSRSLQNQKRRNNLQVITIITMMMKLMMVMKNGDRNPFNQDTKDSPPPPSDPVVQDLNWVTERPEADKVASLYNFFISLGCLPGSQKGGFSPMLGGCVGRQLGVNF